MYYYKIIYRNGNKERKKRILGIPVLTKALFMFVR